MVKTARCFDNGELIGREGRRGEGKVRREGGERGGGERRGREGRRERERNRTCVERGTS